LKIDLIQSFIITSIAPARTVGGKEVVKMKPDAKLRTMSTSFEVLAM